MIKLIPRKALHLSWRDTLAGVVAAVATHDLQHAYAAVETQWHGQGASLACLSVRSGFDLALSALALRPGDEVLVSALTIPHMAALVAAHGGVAIPVDLDPRTMAPTVAALRRNVSPRTRAVLIAHLFGGRIDIGAAADMADERGIALIEDCAQVFDGGEFRGNARASVSLFSFGSIKTATALGGALAVVRDAGLLAERRRLRDAQPVVSEATYLRKVLKYEGIRAMTNPYVFGAAVAALRTAGVDVDETLNALTRSFRGTDLLSAIRQQPSAAMMVQLRRRICSNVKPYCDARRRNGAALSRRLPGSLMHLGSEAQAHCHWLFPVVAKHPAQLIARLAAAGFDATQGGDTLSVVQPPAQRFDTAATTMAALMPQVVYLPVLPTLTGADLERLVSALHHYDQALQHDEEQPS